MLKQILQLKESYSIFQKSKESYSNRNFPKSSQYRLHTKYIYYVKKYKFVISKTINKYINGKRNDINKN